MRVRLPTSGKVFISVKHADRPKAIEVARAADLILVSPSSPLVARVGDCRCGSRGVCRWAVKQ